MKEESLSYLRLLGLVLWGRRPTQEELKGGLPAIPIRHCAQTKPAKGNRQAAPPRPLPRPSAAQDSDQPHIKAAPSPQAAAKPPAEGSSRQDAVGFAIGTRLAKPARQQPFLSSEQATFSFRYEAMILPPVIALYEVTGRLELPRTEKELLESMLSKCGLAEAQSARSLPWPPPFPLAEKEDNDHAREAYEGFLMSLAENHKCDWLILLGESRSPPLSIPARVIQLDSLRLLFQEPIRRKKAWDRLTPLRSVLRPG